MNTPRRFVALCLAVLLTGLLSACKTTPKTEAKKEVEGIDYILVHETGSLVPRKIRTKADALNTQKRNSSIAEFESLTGTGPVAPSDNPRNAPTLQSIPGTR
jgi:hypothetical protein